MAEDGKAAEEAAGSESSAESKATETEEATKSSEKPNKGEWIPRDRFNEVNDQKKEIQTRYETLEQQFADRQNELSQMIELLQSREQDSALVSHLRELGLQGTEEQKALIKQLDEVLQGKEPEVEEAEEGKQGDPDRKAIKKTNELLEQTREELSESIEDQKEDLIVMQANMVADKYFEALPEQYTDQDKTVISELLVDRVKWDGIREDPSTLSDEIARAFEETCTYFGTPRGSVAEEAEKTEETPEAKPAPEEEIPENLKIEWGELKEVQLPDGKTTLKPVHSDDDFRAALADELRKGGV